MANRPGWVVANQARQSSQRRIAAMGNEGERRQALGVLINDPKDIPGTRANFLESLKPRKER